MRIIMKTITVKTTQHTQFLDITREVQQAVTASEARDGVCVVCVPHTTAGIMINENADPDVMTDIGNALEKIVPWEGRWRHTEGNAAAHVKAVLVGSSVHVPVADGRLQFGTWQGIFFCEFDGPRTRNVCVSVVAEGAS
jgi:secondary thiamine-phosphate synthase enzyme